MNSKDRNYVVEKQKLLIGKEIQGDKILDIGGGGEGVIGVCYGKRVTAIDKRQEELDEAPEGPVKIVMDASNLTFQNDKFDAATSFFTMMFIDKADHKKVFNEVYRVLKSGAEFVLWDAVMPKMDSSKNDIFIIELEVNTPNKLIETSYGVLKKDYEQDLTYFKKLGIKAGFEVVKAEDYGKTFKVVFRK
ncbi:class I SAM-dependent methyltransferase [Clostridium hydrogenum]|uniref:class I SAM-dependent methyltransferase n=1 Tax=Clostridium hydrogenum TaxID=2855764 RepID=UPI001F352858|nr:class I SAM-dependent methyltransferase [Clostridium hydrogenum]